MSSPHATTDITANRSAFFGSVVLGQCQFTVIMAALHLSALRLAFSEPDLDLVFRCRFSFSKSSLFSFTLF
jgi:hypothetical protein